MYLVQCYMFTWFKVKKTRYIPHTVHYCCSSLPCLSETCQFFTKLIVLKTTVCSDWPAIQCIVIGRIPQVFDGNVTPLTIFGNTQHPHISMVAAATARMKVTPSLRIHLSGVMQMFPHSDVDLWNISLGLRPFTDLIYARTARNTPETKENIWPL